MCAHLHMPNLSGLSGWVGMWACGDCSRRVKNGKGLGTNKAICEGW